MHGHLGQYFQEIFGIYNDQDTVTGEPTQKGMTPISRSGVITDTEKLKPVHVSAGRRQKGHPRHKNPHQNPLLNY